jgi:hypothetical protein
MELPSDPNEVGHIIFQDIHSAAFWQFAIVIIKQTYGNSAKKKIAITIKDSTIFINTAQGLEGFRSKTIKNCRFVHEHAKHILDGTLSEVFLKPGLSYMARQNEKTRRTMKEAVERAERSQGDEKAKWLDVIEHQKRLFTMPGKRSELTKGEFVFADLLNGVIDPSSKEARSFITCYMDFINMISENAQKIINSRYAGIGRVKDALMNMVRCVIHGQPTPKYFFWGLPGNGKTYAGYVFSFALSFLEIIRYYMQRINYADIIQLHTILWKRYQEHGGGELDCMLDKYNTLFKKRDNRVTAENFREIFLLFLFRRLVDRAFGLHEKLQDRCFGNIRLAAEKGDNGIMGESRVFVNSGPGKFIEELSNDPTDKYFNSLMEELDAIAAIFGMRGRFFFSEDVVGLNRKEHNETCKLIIFDEIDKYKNKHGEDSSKELLAIFPDGGASGTWWKHPFTGTQILIRDLTAIFCGNSNEINSALLSRLHPIFVPVMTRQGIADVLFQKITEALKGHQLNEIVLCDIRMLADQLSERSSLSISIRELIQGVVNSIARFAQSHLVVETQLRNFGQQRPTMLEFDYNTMIEHADPEFVNTLSGEDSTFNKDKGFMVVAVPDKDGALKNIKMGVKISSANVPTRALINYTGSFCSIPGGRNPEAIREDLSSAIMHIMHSILQVAERFKNHKYIVTFDGAHPKSLKELCLYFCLMIMRTLVGKYNPKVWIAAGVEMNGKLVGTKYNPQAVVIQILKTNPELTEVVIPTSIKSLKKSIEKEIKKHFKKRKIKIITMSTLKEFLDYAGYHN